MASLYIKDDETNRLAERLARRRGLTKTAAVRMALTHELERRETPGPPGDVQAVLERFWANNRLGDPTGLEADKAFYDSLNDEDDD